MYTLRKEKEADRQISEHLDIIKKEILSKLKVKSIILIGTYSRGEGSIFLDNRTIIPANDYDLYLVMDKCPHDNLIFELQEKSVKKIREYILEKLGDKRLLRGFNVDIKCLTLNQLQNLAPVLRFYEMRDTKTIYGNNYTGLIPKYGSLPLSEGLRLIFNEISHIFDYMTLKNFDGKVNYFLSKAYLSIMTSFLI